MRYRAFLNTLFLGQRDSPDFHLLPAHTRARLNLLSLCSFLFSAEGARFVGWSIVWLLSGYLCVWALDLRGALASLPGVSLCLWALPWLRLARRRHIRKLCQ